MKWAVASLLAALAVAQGPVHAQDRGWRKPPEQSQGLAPRGREDRDAARRERAERRVQRREQRFTPEEREKLRQDLIDANREIKRK